MNPLVWRVLGLVFASLALGSTLKATKDTKKEKNTEVTETKAPLPDKKKLNDALGVTSKKEDKEPEKKDEEIKEPENNEDENEGEENGDAE